MSVLLVASRRCCTNLGYNRMTIFSTTTAGAGAAPLQRRFLSSSSSSSMGMSLLPSIPVTAVPPARVGALVSRRQWKKLYQKPSSNDTKNNNNTDHEKPWPLSFRITGFVAAITIVPYIVSWYVATNVVVRNALEPYMPNGTMSLLRMWFGESELQCTSYVDLQQQKQKQQEIDNDSTVLPVSLIDEPSTQRRQEQMRLEQDFLRPDIRLSTRIRVYNAKNKNENENEVEENGFSNLVTSEIVELPATTLVTSQSLLQALYSTNNNNNSSSSNNNNNRKEDRRQVPLDLDSTSYYVTVEFTNTNTAQEEHTDETTAMDVTTTTTTTTTTTSSSTTMNEKEESKMEESSVNNNNKYSTSSLATFIKDLIHKTQVMSSWHHQVGRPNVTSTQQQLQQPTTKDKKNSTATATAAAAAATTDHRRWSPDELRMVELEYQTESLQKQLSDPTTMRNLHDLEQEYNQAKREHSKLKWKQRLKKLW